MDRTITGPRSIADRLGIPITRRTALSVATALLAAPLAASAQTPDAESEAARVLRLFLDRLYVHLDFSVIDELVAEDIPPQDPADVPGRGAFKQRLVNLMARRSPDNWRETIVHVFGTETDAAAITHWQEMIGGTPYRQGQMLVICQVAGGKIAAWATAYVEWRD